MLRQQLCGNRPDVTDSKRVQQSLEWLRLRRLYCGDQRIGALVGVALQLEELIFRDRVEISRIANEAGAHELFDAGVRKPANVHRAARGEMHQSFQLPPGARDVRAIDRG